MHSFQLVRGKLAEKYQEVSKAQKSVMPCWHNTLFLMDIPLAIYLIVVTGKENGAFLRENRPKGGPKGRARWRAGRALRASRAGLYSST